MKLFLIGLCLTFAGCTAALQEKEVKPFDQLQYGMAKLQMTDLLGKPDSVEIYKKSDQTRMEFYIYIAQYGATQERVPVCLIDNKVVGWGKTYYQDHLSTDDIRIK
jgi:hypothetical protein